MLKNRVFRFYISALIILVVFSLLALMGGNAEANYLYDGKSSDVFNADSVTIKNQAILDEVVRKIKQDKKMLQLLVVVVSPEIKKDQEKTGKLGEKCFRVLEKYFAKALPGVEVMGQGSSVLIEKDQSPPPYSDVLKIQVVYTANLGAPGETLPDPEYPKEEEWKKELLKRYRKVEEEHRWLCEKPFKRIESEFTCGKYEKRNREYYACMMAHAIYIYTDLRHSAVRGERYDYDRILALEETSEEVYKIAAEIQMKDPEAGFVNYNGKYIAQAVQHQLLAVKYFLKARKIAELGVQGIKEYDGREEDVSDVENAYDWWHTITSGFGSYYSVETREKAINHVRGLHNYVRRNLGLDIIDSNFSSPICVETTMIKNKRLTLSFWKEMYRSEVVPRMHKFGIEDFRLSDNIDIDLE